MGKTMKRIPLEPTPKTLLGKPFRIPDTEQEPAPEVHKCKRCGADVEVVKPAMIEKATLIDLLKVLILNIPRQACTMQDSINAFDFMQQAAEAEDGVLKVTDGTHKWLEETCKKYGMEIYGINTQALMSALDSFERLHEPAKEK